tara:strand:- start:285 stop:776 length:492 start_codon:yes stop_codon:yes gene_type:complete
MEKDFVRISHLTTKKVISDMEAFKFNTSISALMEYSTELLRGYENLQISKKLWKSSIERLLLHLAPLAPHVAEELWEIAGNNFSIHHQSLPEYEEKLIMTDNHTIILQVNGKLRDTLNISSALNEDELKKLALKSENIKKHIDNKTIVKSIYVKNKLLNLVVK